ncbi:MAG TPA: diguanylate cyclase [Acidimicrobiales bacterium]|nr:diguanylate cyclase [Acidimicrobiales bacterium]
MAGLIRRSPTAETDGANPGLTGAAVRAMVRSCRLGDEIYRFGGEEFVLVFVEEQLPEILAATERVRRAVELLAVSHHAQPGRQLVTVSIGVAQFDPLVHSDSDQVLKEADEALYRAKANGRNRVMSSSG